MGDLAGVDRRRTLARLGMIVDDVVAELAVGAPEASTSELVLLELLAQHLRAGVRGAGLSREYEPRPAPKFQPRIR